MQYKHVFIPRPFKPGERITCSGHPGYVESNTCGTLLLGDTSLLHRYCDFINHFRAERDRLHAITLPHHGSAGSWNPAILKDTSDLSFWVSSAGIGNIYDHPHESVVSHLKFEGKKHIVNSQFQAVIINSEFI